jgi:tetratricopeptide (TPR) repeat protein
MSKICEKEVGQRMEKPTDWVSCLSKIILARIKSYVENASQIGWILLVFLPSVLLGADRELYPAPHDSVEKNFRLSEAKECLKKQKWREAVQALREIRKQYPQDLSVVMGLSTALEHMGERMEAVSVLLHFATVGSSAQRHVLVAKARVLSRLFLSNGAFETFQEGLNAYYGKKFRLAREKFEKVLGEDPHHFEVLIKLGQCLLLASEVDLAIEKFKLAKKVNPTDLEASFWLGRGLLARGDYKQSLVELQAAAFEFKGVEYLALGLAEALSLSEQPTLALRLLQTDFREHPLHLQSLFALTQLRFQMGRSDPDNLWVARKDLQLALIHMESYAAEQSTEADLVSGFQKPPEELKAEIQSLLQQIQTRLNEPIHG